MNKSKISSADFFLIYSPFIHNNFAESKVAGLLLHLSNENFSISSSCSNNCWLSDVDQPSKASTYSNTSTLCGIFTIIIAALTLLLALINYYQREIINSEFFYEVLLLPIIIIIIGYLFVAFLKARHSSIVSDLYFSFHEFERNINKACTTMPQVIEYEILFTAREIKEGIPVLQEYLEKRASSSATMGGRTSHPGENLPLTPRGTGGSRVS